MKKETRGGAREGAGRPKGSTSKTSRRLWLQIRVNKKERAKFDAERGRTPMSKYVRGRLGL